LLQSERRKGGAYRGDAARDPTAGAEAGGNPEAVPHCRGASAAKATGLSGSRDEEKDESPREKEASEA